MRFTNGVSFIIVHHSPLAAFNCFHNLQNLRTETLSKDNNGNMEKSVTYQVGDKTYNIVTVTSPSGERIKKQRKINFSEGKLKRSWQTIIAFDRLIWFVYLQPNCRISKNSGTLDTIRISATEHFLIPFDYSYSYFVKYQ